MSNLIRWNPWRELDEMSTQLNRFFGRGETAAPAGKATPGQEAMTFVDWVPAVDVRETNEEYLVKAELPEVKKEDVKVFAKDGYLTVQGERKVEKEEKGKRYHRVERAYGTFLRSFALPGEVDEKKLSAEFKDGMLYIHLPKSETATHRAVEVKVT